MRPRGPAGHPWLPVAPASGRSRRVSLRILHVDHSAVLGGAERSILELAAAQVALGHSVTVAAGQRRSLRPNGCRAGNRRGLARPARRVRGCSRRAGDSRGLGAGMASRRSESPDLGRDSRDPADSTCPHLQGAARDGCHALDTHGRRCFTSVTPCRVDPILRPPTVRLRRSAHAVALTSWMTGDYERGATPRSGTSEPCQAE